MVPLAQVGHGDGSFGSWVTGTVFSWVMEMVPMAHLSEGAGGFGLMLVVLTGECTFCQAGQPRYLADGEPLFQKHVKERLPGF